MAKRKKRRRKSKLQKKFYMRRRILVVAILLILIAMVGVISTYTLREFKSIRHKYNIKLQNYKIEEMRLNLDINEKEYQWSQPLAYLNMPSKVIVHHSASKDITVEEIDKMHKSKGWSGIGYHYFINKKGEVFRGRPERTIGAHAYKNNENTLGICLEGNFEEELIEDIQYDKLIELIKYLSVKYPIKDIIGHRDVVGTLCPGRNINDEKIKEDVIKEIEKIK